MVVLVFPGQKLVRTHWGSLKQDENKSKLCSLWYSICHRTWVTTRLHHDIFWKHALIEQKCQSQLWASLIVGIFVFELWKFISLISNTLSIKYYQNNFMFMYHFKTPTIYLILNSKQLTFWRQYSERPNFWYRAKVNEFHSVLFWSWHKTLNFKNRLFG